MYISALQTSKVRWNQFNCIVQKGHTETDSPLCYKSFLLVSSSQGFLNCGDVKLVWHHLFLHIESYKRYHILVYSISYWIPSCKKSSKGRSSREGPEERAVCLLAECGCSAPSKQQRKALKITNWWSSCSKGDNVKICKQADRIMQKLGGKGPCVKRRKWAVNSFSIILLKTKNYIGILKNSHERKMLPTKTRNHELQLTLVRVKLSFCNCTGVGEGKESVEGWPIQSRAIPSFPSTKTYNSFLEYQLFYFGFCFCVFCWFCFNHRTEIHLTECRCLSCSYLMLSQFYTAEPAAWFPLKATEREVSTSAHPNSSHPKTCF